MDDAPPALDAALLELVRDRRQEVIDRLIELQQCLTRLQLDQVPHSRDAVRALFALLDRVGDESAPPPADPPTDPSEPSEPSEPSAESPADVDAGTAPVDPPRSDPAQVVRDRLTDALLGLWQEMRDTPGSRPFTEPFPEPAHDAAAVWSVIHQVCLRLPANLAAKMRRDATSLVQEAIPDFDPAGTDLPPLPIDGVVGGGRGSDPVDDEIEMSVYAINRVGARTVRFARCLTWLSVNDPAVRNGVDSMMAGRDLVTFGGTTLYQRNMKQALQKIQRSIADTPEEFDALLGLDDLLRGVVPVPLPASDSWWHAELANLHDRLKKHPGAGGTKLSLPTAASSGMLDSLNYPHARNIVGRPEWIVEPPAARNIVLWVLRFPRPGPKGAGRVIYRADG